MRKEKLTPKSERPGSREGGDHGERSIQVNPIDWLEEYALMPLNCQHSAAAEI